jgi:nanoRNase/pAp phosphatase (c-di-AMP/oligoRNAs hydrolase)
LAFPVEFEGHKAWAINKGLSNSKIFETFKRGLWILFTYKAGTWEYSLYPAPRSGIDVSKIAVKYGGGGHAGAARFQSDKFLLKEY